MLFLNIWYKEKVKKKLGHFFHKTKKKKKKVLTNLWIWTHVLVLDRQLTSNLFFPIIQMLYKELKWKNMNIWCLGRHGSCYCRFPLLTVWTDTLNSGDPRFSTIFWFLWNAIKASWIILVKSVGTVNHTTMLIGSTVKRRPYGISHHL